MQHLLRKYKRPLLIIGAILIIPTFILWGGSFGRDRGPSGPVPGSVPVATVGKVPVTALDLRDALNQEVQQRARFGKAPSLQEMAMDGTAERILTALINQQLVDQKSEQLGYAFDKEFLADQLKEWPDFQNEEGLFDPRKWNDFVDNPQMNWDAIYSMVAGRIRQGIVLDEMGKSARVLDRDLREQFERMQTKVAVRYVAIAPPVTPTEEDIRAQYDKNPAAYDTPEQRRAEFAAVSLEAPRPESVDEAVRRARAGDDFAALAKEYSEGPEKDNGGDMGWVAESDQAPLYESVLFALEPGQVSDAIEGPGGFFIYKVEEIRESEGSADKGDLTPRAVHARRIIIRPELDEAERAARESQAESIAAKAKEGGDLKAAAGDVPVVETEWFSAQSFTIDNVPDDDAGAFRMAVMKLNEGEASDVIKARKNLYVAKVIERKPPETQPFEAVRDRVEKDTIQAIEASEEHRAKAREMANKAGAEAKSLDQILAMFPVLGLEIKEVPPFTARDYDFQSGPLWRPDAVIEAVEKIEPGQIAGPIFGWTGEAFFVELVSKEVPDEQTFLAKWDEEKENLQERARAMARRNRIDDYLLDMRERSQVRIDQKALLDALGVGKEEPGEATGEQPEAEAAGDGAQSSGDVVTEEAPAPGEEPATE